MLWWRMAHIHWNEPIAIIGRSRDKCRFLGVTGVTLSLTQKMTCSFRESSITLKLYKLLKKELTISFFFFFIFYLHAFLSKKKRWKKDSYRPTSILNIIYKLYTSVLAGGLEKILLQLIHNDQTGFISQRHAHDNIIIISADIKSYWTRRTGNSSD